MKSWALETQRDHITHHPGYRTTILVSCSGNKLATEHYPPALTVLALCYIMRMFDFCPGSSDGACKILDFPECLLTPESVTTRWGLEGRNAPSAHWLFWSRGEEWSPSSTKTCEQADELLSCGHMEVSGAWLPRQSMEAVPLRLVPFFPSLPYTLYPM